MVARLNLVIESFLFGIAVLGAFQAWFALMIVPRALRDTKHDYWWETVHLIRDVGGERALAQEGMGWIFVSVLSLILGVTLILAS